ncbi:hypothetical protein JOD64_006056 [Micromonospora luteifusca]|uniref:Uncharacterized protein n=1 Tax=Micromonospora luteifusca TaxID=709860 RepID=A0ABS2M307_9ACTN|nr:hypothetical protein [Micromonospora luteifusca]MBM7494834.1 hypothetical protein [Micromonospora luteifusca]
MAAAVKSGALRLSGDEDARRRLTDLLLAPFTPAPQPATPNRWP